MIAVDALKELDERIQASIARIQQLREENEKLAQQLADSERRFGEVSEQLKQLDSDRRQRENERSEIKDRIGKILARFDGLDLG